MGNINAITTMNKNLIVCTGFDIFKGHEDKNASWEAVKLLPNTLEFKGKSFEIKKELIKVEYDAVDQAIPKIWEQNPKLVIHVGVSHMAKCVTLEACSYNFNYCKVDYSQKFLAGAKANMCKNGVGKQILLTNLDVEKIASELNGVEVDKNCCEALENRFVCSKEVGNYLCGYIYLKSLDVNQDRTLFIHVPPVNKPLSSQDTKDCLVKVITKCLEQLEENKLL